MDLVQAILLGIVQGATEFLPVSSSGHLIIISKLTGGSSSFEFDVLVNFGTLLAVIVYYRRQLIQILRQTFIKKDLRIATALIVATVPAVLVGFFLQSIIEEQLHSTGVVIVMLLLVGMLMIRSRRWQPKPSLEVNKNIENITLREAFFIGVAQCVSLISGTSRSGITILAGLKLGFNKQRATSWSFLMAIPIIFGASVKVLLSSEGNAFISNHTSQFIISNIVSFLSGLLAISLLVKLIERYGLYFFGWYRIILACVLIILLSAKII